MLDQLTTAALAQYGAYALPIIGLAWAVWLERQRAERERERADGMTERMIEQSKTYLDEAARREEGTLHQLQSITAFINGRQL